MSLAANDIIRITWEGRALSQMILFVTHWRVTANADANNELAELRTICNDMADPASAQSPYPAYLACLPTGYKNYRVSAQRVTPNKTSRVDVFDGSTGTGGAGPDAPNVAATFSLAAATPGRSKVAKYHIGPLPNAFYTNGLLSNTCQANISVLAGKMLGIMDYYTADLTLVSTILHRAPNANPRFHDTALPRFNIFVRTQRRRTIGVGK